MFKSRFFCSLVQSLWLATCIPEAIKFKKAAQRSVEVTQRKVLKEILTCTSNTSFAQKYKFDQIQGIASFQQAVPISNYDDLKEWIDSIADGEERVLTDDPVSMFELTSGSTAATKLIPYTPMLQQAFNRALHPWLLDLYSHTPGIWGGASYWVITPKTGSGKKTKGGIPVGFAADSEYFGRWGKYLVDTLMAVKAEVSGITDIDCWKYVTLLSLLRCENLRLISLWNPTFLSSLMKELERFAPELERDLATGNCCMADNPERFKADPMPRRAVQFAHALAELGNGRFDLFSRQMWPKLALISSWTDAEAKAGAQRLKKDFPQAVLQTKGLLATEGPVTIPIVGAPAPVLAVRSAFFEFIENSSESEERIFLAHQLEEGKCYKVLMTTFGGLFRYRLNDIVWVKGFYKQLPCLEFMGKDAMFVDLCGEKLSAGHVKEIFSRFLGSSSTAFMAPERAVNDELPGYTVFVCNDEMALKENRLQEMIEAELKTNFHYNWCVEAGQLRPVKILLLEYSQERFQQIRLERLQQEGFKFSTAKAGVLTSLGNWTEWFHQNG